MYTHAGDVYILNVKMTNKKAREFAARLNEALDIREYPAFGRGRVNYIQEIFNISRSGANKWLHGKAIPHPNARRQIAEKLGINLTWLETGEGSATTFDQELYKAENQAKKVPLLSLSQAYNLEIALKESEKKPTDTVVINLSSSPSCFAVELIGKAMIPKFDEGSILIVDPNEQPNDGDFVIAKSSMLPEAICRQIVFGSDGKYLVSLNPKFQPIKIKSNEEIIGKIIEVRTAL